MPNNRGNSVIPWHIINNEKQGGLTIFELKEEVDSGKIFYQCSFPLKSNDTSHIYYNNVIDCIKLFINNYLFNNIDKFLINEYNYIKNDLNESTCCKRNYNDSKIDWFKNEKDIIKLVRAMNGPYPNAFTFLKRGSKYYKICIKECEIIENIKNNYIAEIGTVINDNNNLLIKTINNYIKIDEYISDEKVILNHNDRFDNQMTIEVFNLLNIDKKLIKTQELSSNVLVIVAHPDDETYGCGGYIKKLTKNGNKVFVLILTDGCTTQYNSSDSINLKKKESQKVKEILGIQEYFHENLLDMKLDSYHEVEITKIINKYIDFVKPNTVLTHNDVDLNKDHRIINACVQVACRPQNNIKKLLTFEVLSTTELSSTSFLPNKFINITDEINDKVNACNAYKSEIRNYPHGRCEESVITLAKFRGICSNYKYAESFKILKDYED